MKIKIDNSDLFIFVGNLFGAIGMFYLLSESKTIDETWTARAVFGVGNLIAAFHTAFMVIQDNKARV